MIILIWLFSVKILKESNIGEEKYENEEKTSAIAVKRITRKGSERIIRSAFEYAKIMEFRKLQLFIKQIF